MQPQPSNPASLGESAAARPLRPLLPGASPRNEAPPSQSKRARVSLACAACRTRKTKCNGGRPYCSECVTRDSHCQYTETENTQTKRKHQDLEELFELLKLLPEDNASEILGRIRDGVEPRDIVETVTHGNMLMQFASKLGNKKDSSNERVEKKKNRSGSGEGDGKGNDDKEGGGSGGKVGVQGRIKNFQPGRAAEETAAENLVTFRYSV